MTNQVNEESARNITQGVHHIGLTVPSLNETKEFFLNVLGFKQVGEKPAYPAVFVSDGTIMITLWQAANPEIATKFDRHNNIGLHHIALAVPDAESLNTLHQRLIEIETVTIEFVPESLGGGPTQHMMCAIPGGIRMEFIAKG